MLAVPLTAQAFQNPALRGSWAYRFEGAATFIGKRPLGLPTWAVGTLKTDGAGNVTALDGTFDIGGCGVLKEELVDGTYTVNQNGTGSADITVSTTLVDGSLNENCPVTVTGFIQSLVQNVGNIKFSFAFAIVRPRQEIEIIGLNLTTEDGVPIVAFGAHGTAQHQLPQP